MLSFFPRDVLDEIWDLIESVSQGFPTYIYHSKNYYNIYGYPVVKGNSKHYEKKVQIRENSDWCNNCNNLIVLAVLEENN